METGQTRRLFYENVYLKEFAAAVLTTGEDEHGTYILLDQTAFYPEGGGQPSDRGYLYLDGEEKDRASGVPRGEAAPREPEDLTDLGTGHEVRSLHVWNVQYAGEEIRHYVESLPEKCLREGDRVRGVIDWERRFDLMQQHSGEHIVSGFIHRKFGYDNVGFHMGEDVITIDTNGLLDEEQLRQIEKEVNDYIWSGRHTKVFFPDGEEREALPYRSKKELTGQVRLVEFPGGDLCACCGLHVETTGEIGLVKLLSAKHFREGVRIEMVAGKRALRLLHGHLSSNTQVAEMLSVKPDGTPAAVQRLLDEIYALKGQIIHLREEQSAMRAAQCEGKGDVLLFEQGLDAAAVRKEADRILDVCGGICAVLSLDETGGRYAVGQRNGNVRELIGEMNAALSGKGGGKPEFAQGSLQAGREEIEAFFAARGFTICS